MTTFTRNQRSLLAIYYLSSPSERHDGMTWYDRAQDFCRNTGLELGVPYDVVAAVVAVLSPRQSWVDNKNYAHGIIEWFQSGLDTPNTEDFPVFKVNVDKAWGILTANQNNETFTQFVRGPKVTAFYHNLLGHNAYLTIDTHALNAWCGGVREFHKYTKKERTQCDADYRVVAEHLGLAPSALQAIIWVTWRGMVFSQERLATLG